MFSFPFGKYPHFAKARKNQFLQKQTSRHQLTKYFLADFLHLLLAFAERQKQTPSMTENVQIALTVLATGMITVFAILSLVVLSGNVLIRIVNRYVPVNEVPKTKRSKNAFRKKSSAAQPATMAAIIAAVEIATGGTGKITSIEKLSAKNN